MDPSRPHHASLAERPTRRPHPRQEPSALAAHAGICAGGRPQGRSLPRFVEFDIRKFFDSVPWDKVVRAVEAHTDARWVVLYVKRWLAAGLRLPGGSVAERDQGTPQGSSVSPVLANLFLHYAFDMWLTRNYPAAKFERYADDGAPRTPKEVSV